MLAYETIELVDKFVYLGRRVIPGGLAKDDIFIRIEKARAAFVSLCHLWRSRDISLPFNGRVYNPAVRSMLLYGSETWPLRVEDVKMFSVSSEHRPSLGEHLINVFEVITFVPKLVNTGSPLSTRAVTKTRIDFLGPFMVTERAICRFSKGNELIGFTYVAITNLAVVILMFQCKKCGFKQVAVLKEE
ncbi:hypothetical protein T265_03868 [Opisthorchis viverrini]|uniref:Uncharacterized protein n=1 Tax=Opisthorchis viverrini TaxID=6198 RepID=A0A074ZQ78_OPIVI|nr:hypothetical protein T265_03868 [Opisthorchis viverrini]KER29573.1 hypothetical protein T265_03868 [Opisthorchis viverrini]